MDLLNCRVKNGGTAVGPAASALTFTCKNQPKRPGAIFPLREFDHNLTINPILHQIMTLVYGTFSSLIFEIMFKIGYARVSDSLKEEQRQTMAKSSLCSFSLTNIQIETTWSQKKSFIWTISSPRAPPATSPSRPFRPSVQEERTRKTSLRIHPALSPSRNNR